jgi:hypothetical protein
MVSKPSKADQKIMTLEEFGQDVMRRRAALGGDIDMPRNSGERRTASKRALLEAIEATGKKW